MKAPGKAHRSEREPCMVYEPNWIRRAILIETARAANVDARLCGFHDVILMCPGTKAREIADAACRLWRKFERIQLRALMELLDNSGLRVPEQVIVHLDSVDTDVAIAWRVQPDVQEVSRGSRKL